MVRCDSPVQAARPRRDLPQRRRRGHGPGHGGAGSGSVRPPLRARLRLTRSALPRAIRRSLVGTSRSARGSSLYERSTPSRTSFPTSTRRDRGWIAALDQIIDQSPARAAFLLHRILGRPVPPDRGPGHGHHPLHQHHRPGRRAGFPATGMGGGSGAWSGGTPPPWWPGQQAPRGDRQASPPTPREPRCSRSASTTSSGAELPRRRRSRLLPGPRRTGIYARTFLEGRWGQEKLDRFRQEALLPGRALPPPSSHA